MDLEIVSQNKQGLAVLPFIYAQELLTRTPRAALNDFSITIKGNSIFEKRYARHVETGKESKSDPMKSGT